MPSSPQFHQRTYMRTMVFVVSQVRLWKPRRFTTLGQLLDCVRCPYLESTLGCTVAYLCMTTNNSKPRKVVDDGEGQEDLCFSLLADTPQSLGPVTSDLKISNQPFRSRPLQGSPLTMHISATCGLTCAACMYRRDCRS